MARRAWMMLRMEMYLERSYSLVRACAETMMFFGCSSRRITSSTVVFRTCARADHARQPLCIRDDFCHLVVQFSLSLAT